MNQKSSKVDLMSIFCANGVKVNAASRTCRRWSACRISDRDPVSYLFVNRCWVKLAKPFLSQVVGTLFVSLLLVQGATAASQKKGSVFYPAVLVDNAVKNAEKYEWARRWQTELVSRAKPWLKFSDDELWELMFGPDLPRAWEVCAVGRCPSCKNKVTEFSWHADVITYPWKMRCPFCRDLFPKNDFLAYYRSGLDDRYLFDPALADRSLLYNQDHPDPADPLHLFGVDDGGGYSGQDGLRYHFIATYLVYGQWKQFVLDGIRRLGIAYSVTGDPIYAHKAGILLDRVADIYPSLDYAEQECYSYGRETSTGGFVSLWHDSCQETLALAMSYDRVFDAISQDKELVRFLSHKARQYHLDNPKSSFADIQWNIESRIIAGGQEKPIYLTGRKIACNFPYTNVAMSLMQSIVQWPHCKQEVYDRIDSFMPKLTQADGVTDEKGLTQYSAWPLTGFSIMLAEFDKVDPEFLKNLYAKHPRLRETYRFFVDLWCQDRQYYPNNGNAVNYAFRQATFLPAIFQRPGRDMGRMIGWALTERDDRILWHVPSTYSLFWRLYEVIGDPFFVQVLYGENDRQIAGLPWDLHAFDPESIAEQVQHVIEQEGPTWPRKSTNKQQYCLAVLRGKGDRQSPELWLDYDNVGIHSDDDGMHLGLFAKGLDLMPDLGYGLQSYHHVDATKAQQTRLTYYHLGPGHNTVVVDGHNFDTVKGKTTFWADGQLFQAIRCSAPGMLGFLNFAGNPEVLAAEEGQLLANGRFSEEFAQWKVTGSGWTIRHRRGPDGPHAYCGEKQTGTLSQTTRVRRRYLKWYAKGWDGSRAGDSGLNYLQILDQGGKVLKTLRPVQSDEWQNQHTDLYALGLKQGDPFVFKAVDGKATHGYAWLALDGFRQANRVEDFQPVKQFERTAALISMSEEDSYVVDIFRVVGGQDHAKFMRSHFGAITTERLSLQPSAGYEHFSEAFRNWKVDHSPQPGWSVDWKIKDRYEHLTPAANIHLRYTDLSHGVEAYTAESWIFTNFAGHSAFGYPAAETWIPTIMQRRQSANGSAIASTFVSVIEPYQQQSNILSIRRLTLETEDGEVLPENNVAVEVNLRDGQRDLFIAVDAENPKGWQPAWQPNRRILQAEWKVALAGELAWIRLDQNGRPQRIAIGKAQNIAVGEVQIPLVEKNEFAEFQETHGQWKMIAK